ncbi:MAG TPA: M28 family peptidase [Lentimicrobium sp.]|nr:M28 family peptidase [Lentimicrobium sp.]
MISISGCNSNVKPNKKDDQKAAAKTVNVPQFNADTAYLFIQKQLSFGPRVPNTKAHRECGDWLVATLKKYNATVTEQKARLRAFDGTMLDARNIIGSINPEQRSRILLCAHWDSRPWADHDPDAANHKKPVPAANDGASGAAVLLEIARVMSIENPGVGVDIILFDAEDYGEPQDFQGAYQDAWALGSQYWSKNPHVPGYTARFGILLDMVGAEGAVFAQEGNSRYYAPNIVRKVWETADRIGFGNFFINRNSGQVIDDHLYINENLRIPTIDIIDYSDERDKGFFDYWHTVGDDIDKISKETLKAVGQTVTAVVYEAK